MGSGFFMTLKHVYSLNEIMYHLNYGVHNYYLFANQEVLLMETKWNMLTNSQKTLLVIIKDLSYYHGSFVPTESISEKYAALNYENGIRSLGPDTASLNRTGYTRSRNEQFIEGHDVNCIEVTNEGMIFIFKNQLNIDSWKTYKSKHSDVEK
jgi:hypothetical protein